LKISRAQFKRSATATAMAVAVATAGIVVAANPASAAGATCTSSPLSSGNWLGTGNGYYFQCSGTTPATINVQIGCAGITGNNRWVTHSFREIGAPWSIGDSIYCSNVEYADMPGWWTS
jgi:hypothetical protein